MNQNGPSDNIDIDPAAGEVSGPGEPMSRLAKFCFVAWIAATMVVYFLAFGTRYVVSLFRRMGLGSLGGWLQQLSDDLMTWFSARGA